MKLKKILAMLLAVCLVLGMVACGASESAAPAESAAAAPAEAAASAEAPAEVPAVECEPLVIEFSTTYNETETGGQLIKYFENALSEASGGAITLNIYWGGTLFSDTEVLEALSTGAINMTPLAHMPLTNTLNYLGFPAFAPGGSQAALDFFNEIMFNNAETAAYVEQEATDNGIKYLNVVAGGANAFCTSYEFTDLATLVSGSKSFGNTDAAIFEMLGFQVTATGPGDVYDALQRGLIDSTQMALTPMVSMSWQDVASYWAIDGTYSAGNPYTVNLEWWNGLSDAQRQAIQTACDAVETYSAGIYDDAIASDIATVEAATGNKFVEFSQEDIDAIWAANFEAKASAALSAAEANGKAEGMTKILEVAAAFTNYNWEH